MKFFLYQGRSGGQFLVERTRAGWDFLISKMEDENRISMSDAEQEGFEIGGSFEEGYLYMEDGGSIETIEVTSI